MMSHWVLIGLVRMGQNLSHMMRLGAHAWTWWCVVLALASLGAQPGRRGTIHEDSIRVPRMFKLHVHQQYDKQVPCSII
jgi:hypothetical protein